MRWCVRLWPACLLSSAFGSLSAALAGLPVAAAPGPVPTAAVWWLNDAFGGTVVHNDDDYRTNSVAGLMRWDHVVVGVDHSMLTDKAGRGAGIPARVDVLTASLGGMASYESEHHAAWLMAGGGVQVRGNLAGQRIQERWHANLRIPFTRLPYEDGARHRYTPFAFAAAQWLGTIAVDELPPPLSYLLDRSRLGLALDAQGIIDSDHGASHVLGAARIVALGREAALWLGVEQRGVRGDVGTATAYAVAAHEAGTWFVAGGMAGPFFIEATTEADGASATGRVGLAWPLDSARSVALVRPAPLAFAAETGPALVAAGLCLQVRLWPTWLREATASTWFAERTALFIDYRFGRMAGVELPDTSLRANQVVLGLDLEPWPLRSAPPGMAVRPFAQSGLGVRVEGFQPEGAQPLITGLPTATRGVALASLGLRARLIDLAATQGPDPAVPRWLGASLSLDGWLPLHDATTNRSTGETQRFQLPGWSATARLLAQVQW